jgi:multidrug efflux pump
MREVTGPVIAIVLVLCAVFVPIAFLGGLTGELYRQFAVTIAIAVVISGVVALTLTPALCVLILKHGTTNRRVLPLAFNRGFARVTTATRRRRLDDPRGAIGSAAVRRHGRAHRLAVADHPGSLVPDEDQGYYISAVILPDGATLERTDKVVQKSGGDQVQPGQRGRGRLHRLRLPRRRLPQQRGDHLRHAEALGRTHVDTQQLVGELFMKTAHIKEALVLAFNPPPIFGLGNAGGFEFYIQNRGEGGPRRLAEVMQQFLGQGQPGSHAGRRADALARQRAAALRRRRSREGQGARRAARRRSTTRSPPRWAPTT